MLKRIIALSSALALTLTVYADRFSISESEQNIITQEAEDWIDELPAGLQDRMSDAVDHAIRNFYSEIQAFRNISDTIGLNNFKVKIRDIKGGNDANIPLRLYEAENKRADSPLLIYFHGGGWSLGSLNVTEKFCRALASIGNVTVVSVDYPLAPEHPYPEAKNLCRDAVNYIFTHAMEWACNPDCISLGGDGAGANLALSVFEVLNENSRIKSLVLYYPMIKTSGELNPDLKRKYGRGYGFDSRLWNSFTEAYNGKDIEFTNPLPPTLIISAGRDIILDETTELVKNNNNVTLVEFSGALHGFITDGHQKAAFNKAVEITDQFLQK